MLNVGKTGAGILDLVWAGVDREDERVTRAAGYIQEHWDRFQDEFPLYIKWLDKPAHFMDAYASLREYFDAQATLG